MPTTESPSPTAKFSKISPAWTSSFSGESHSIARHHDLQTRVLADLSGKGRPLVLGLEQMESVQQPALDRYNRREIDFEELAQVTNWAQRWPNYQQYRAILESARESHTPLIALNARSETIRSVARSGGLDRVDPQVRQELPAEIELNDPPYQKLLDLQMMVHMSANSERLRPMREAQICRDEMMASVLCSFLQSEAGKNRAAVVICGAGHVSYGLGTVARVARRLPAAKYRVIVPSQSGDLELSPEEKAMAREVTITHEQLRAIDRPVADYLYVTSLKDQPRGE